MGAAAVAGIGVLSSMSGDVLDEGIGSALRRTGDRLLPRRPQHRLSEALDTADEFGTGPHA